MANFTTRPEHEWRTVMANWLESKSTAIDSSKIFSDDEYGLLNAAKFAILVFSHEAENQSQPYGTLYF